LLSNKTYGLSIDDDIATAAELEEKEDIYSNEKITISNFE